MVSSAELDTKFSKTALFSLRPMLSAGVGNLTNHHPLRSSAEQHIVDSDGWTLLHVTSHRGYLRVVKLLLRQGADVEVLDSANKAVVGLTSENGKAEVAKFIAEYKTDPNIQSNMRSTTLNTVQVGADENGTDEEMGSLHAATEEGDIDVVKSLLERGADINEHNANDETPLGRAVARGMSKSYT